MSLKDIKCQVLSLQISSPIFLIKYIQIRYVGQRKCDTESQRDTININTIIYSNVAHVLSFC